MGRGLFKEGFEKRWNIKIKVMKTALVCGAGGFFGSHLVKRLKRDSYYVIGVDLKYPEFAKSEADVFFIMDLRNPSAVQYLFNRYTIDEVYQLAADLGGAGYILTGEHDADIISNSALINLNIAKKASKMGVGKLFFPSSTCVYPALNQMYSDPTKDVAYPAQPDNEYGWEKLFSERVYQAHQRNYGLDIRIARLHGIFGPEGAWEGGKEKAPAAMCREVAKAKNGGVVNVWGSGEQTRSYLYIEECLDAVRMLMDSSQSFQPLNIGAEESVSINQLVKMIIEISGKDLTINHVEGPSGVTNSFSDNRLAYQKLNWKPSYSLVKGLEQTYEWIHTQIYDQYREK